MNYSRCFLRISRRAFLGGLMVLAGLWLTGPALGDDYIVELDVISVDLASVGVGPGDTVYLRAGHRDQVYFSNIHGTKEAPILVTNLDGQVVFTSSTSHTIRFSQCDHFILRGTPGEGYDYGIKVAYAARGMSGIAMYDRSSDFEVCDIEITGVGFAGILAKDDNATGPDWAMENVFLHDLYIHDTGGEGFYVGSSFWTTRNPHELHNVHIYNNLIVRAGWDGIQLGCGTQNTSIHDNVIINPGFFNEPSQRSGIQLNPGSDTHIYNNYIEGGSSSGIFLSGRGGNKVYNNIIVRPAGAGINVAEDADLIPGTAYYVMNNTIIEPGGHGCWFRSRGSVGSLFYNNLVVNPGGSYLYRQYANVDVTESNNLYSASKVTVGFVDPATNDYHLLISSPAVDAGLDLSSYGLTYDQENTSRPQGSAYDIGALEYVRETIPGDFNQDGVVDLADYTVWADSFGQTGNLLPADGNGDGTVDLADYTVWADHFGQRLN